MGEKSVKTIFNESALWAYSVIESLCPCACLCVCLCHPETPTSWCWGDLWLKNVSLILACDDTIFLNKFVRFFSRLLERAVLEPLPPQKKIINPLPVSLRLLVEERSPNIATIRIGQEIQFLPYAGFLKVSSTFYIYI